MPPDVAERCPLLLAGRDISVADVFVLLQDGFWLRRHLSFDPVYAARQRLVMGLHALAGFKSPTISAIAFKNCFPERRLIKVAFRDQLLEVPITPALALILSDWMRKRPATASTRLLTTADGPIERQTLDASLWTAGETFGVGHNLSEMLCRFFEKNLTGEDAPNGSEDVVEAYLRRRMAGGQTSAVSFPALRRLIECTDPFRDSLRPFGDIALEKRDELFAASALPPTYDACLSAGSFPGKPKRDLTAAHPLIAELSSMTWPKNRRERAAAREAAYRKHQAEINELVDSGKLPVRQLARLFGMRRESFTRLRRHLRNRSARIGEDAPPAHRFADPTCALFPSVAALSRVTWSKNREERLAKREPLFATYSRDIEALVAQGRLLMKEADALFGFAKNGFRNRLARSDREEHRGRPDHRASRALRDCSSDERTRLDKIALTKWPVAERRIAFRRALLRKNAGFVFALIEARKLRVSDAASLFAVSPTKLSELRGEFKAGTFELAIGADREQDRDYWREIVIREMPNRPEGQGDRAFCIELRKKLGLRLPFDFVRTVVRSIERKPVPARHVPPTRVDRTPDEEQRIALIASVLWTKDNRSEQRRAILKEHFPFVFEMIDARKLTVPEAAQLFRCPIGLMTELRSDYRAGVFDWAIARPVSASEHAEWLALIRREWPKRPDAQTPNEFCRALRKRFGFPLPFASINGFLARQRKTRPADPSLFTVKTSRVKPALSVTDKVCLAALTRAKWSTADDVTTFRRELLRAHFPVIAGMLRDWKLNSEQAGKLFRLSPQRLQRLYSEYRNGTFDLAIAEPLSRDEFAKWHAFLVDEIAKRGSRVDNVTEFWRTLRKERRLPLSLETVRSALKAMHRDTAQFTGCALAA